ncbi:MULTISPECIES: DUF3267 domain-containing protein [Natrialbaceae]|uniref:DUF3267 domain-containing protein n=1 Tax=Natrialbaceae TaxID=1644061 RepID=UPI00207C38ED|nr:DUF3267 domain-containing protein [Natronococcus sp. CG52]
MIAFGWIFHYLTGHPPDVTFSIESGRDGLLTFGTFAALLLAAVVPHELIHGAAMSRYGGRPRYGAGVAYFVLPYAYATSDEAYTRNQLLVILLAPLVLISLVGLVIMVVVPSSWLLVPLAANAAGSVGDVWMAILLLDYSSNVRIEETADGVGIEIYGSETDRRTYSYASLIWNTAIGSAVVFGTLAGASIFAVFGALIFGVESLTVGDPETWWYVLDYHRDPNGSGASFGVGVRLIGVLSVVGGGSYALLTVVRERYPK